MRTPSTKAQTVRMRVPARQLWVEMPTLVRAGQTLVMRASGLWVDFYIVCGPNGYRAGLFYALKRLPRIIDDGRYFRLMGRIHDPVAPPTDDDPAQTFVIGSASTHVAPRDGRLFVFANDGAAHYGNNWGAVTLEVDIV